MENRKHERRKNNISLHYPLFIKILNRVQWSWDLIYIFNFLSGYFGIQLIMVLHLQSSLIIKETSSTRKVDDQQDLDYTTTRYNIFVQLKKKKKSEKQHKLLAYPGTNGKMELPHSFFTMWRSVWHIPQYNTLNATSFSPVSLKKKIPLQQNPIKSNQYLTSHIIIHSLI